MTGPRVICVPGLGLGPPAWHPFLDAAAAVDRSIEGSVVPLPGFGLRPDVDSPTDPVGLARLLIEAAFDATRPAVLLAHSASCQVVAHAAVLAPAAVQALVLVGPTTDPRAEDWPALARRWLATAVHETPRQLPTLARWYSTTGVGPALRVMNSTRHDDIRDPLRRIQCPVLIVRGRHDRICPASWAAELAALSPAGSGSSSLSVGAHMVPLTHGAALADVVADFLR